MKNNRKFNDDGQECYDLPQFGEHFKDTRMDSTIGNVTEVGECIEILHRSDITVAARNKDCK